MGLGNLMSAIGSPQIFVAQKGGKYAYTAALGVSYEMIANEIKDAAFFKDMIKSLSGAICSTIEDIRKNPSKAFGG